MGLIIDLENKFIGGSCSARDFKDQWKELMEVLSNDCS